MPSSISSPVTSAFLEYQSWSADKSQIDTQHAYMRPLGVVAMVLCIDDENGPKLFKCDPASHFFGHKARSAGLKEQDDEDSEELDDIMIKADDAVIVCTTKEDEMRHLVVYIVEDPAGDLNMKFYSGGIDGTSN
ncbi:proteasome subunit alpha type-6 [Artemisia annua]|uniref:Proteasome subunit alpha type-6 n=1 Tax=Artemisia annua TaxID=35608 RepID=A0A2U1P349_ARTAN|nr:proteasome subunit alpha type-6 [Artemisia annua]